MTDPTSPIEQIRQHLWTMRIREGSPTNRQLAALAQCSNETINRLFDYAYPRYCPQWPILQAVTLALKGDVPHIKSLHLQLQKTPQFTARHNTSQIEQLRHLTKLVEAIAAHLGVEIPE